MEAARTRPVRDAAPVRQAQSRLYGKGRGTPGWRGDSEDSSGRDARSSGWPGALGVTGVLGPGRGRRDGGWGAPPGWGAGVAAGYQGCWVLLGPGRGRRDGGGDGGGSRGLEDLGVEVAPGGVGLFDEAEFPGAMPAFEAFFAEVCAFHGGMGFVPDETVDAVVPSKAGNDIGLVLPNATWQV